MYPRLTCTAIALLLWQSAARAEVIRFEETSKGSLPFGWSVAMTHLGGEPRWQIIRDDSAPHSPWVLAQLSGDTTAGRFPLAIWERTGVRNGQVSVAFKPVAGSVDRAAGVVWRYRDPDNYYVARANALENNVALYKVQGGTRSSIAPKGLPSRSYGVKHSIPSGQWNTLRVAFNGSSFSVFLNQERLFDAEDRTFGDAGKVGLWTKADSVTYFTDFTVVRE